MSFIVDAVKGVGNAISGAVKAVGSVFKAAGKVLSSVVNFVASPFLGLFGGMEVPTVDTGSNNPQGTLVQRKGTVEDLNIVYGLRKTAGIVTFCETGSDNNKYLWVAYALSEGVVEGLREVWINDNQVDAEDVKALNSGSAVLLSPGASKSKLAYVTQLQFWTGGYFDNPADTYVGQVIGNGIFKGAPSWETSMHYNGVATIFARYEWKENVSADGTDNNPFASGATPPELKVVLMGKKVARLLAVPPQTQDPVTENYAYGDFAGGYTISYSYNPVECLLDYLRNPRYGKGLKNDEIDWDSWRIAARKCQTPVTYFKGKGDTGMILPFNYIVGTGSTIFNNVQDMLKNFRAYMPYSNGKFKLFIEDAGAYNNDITSSSYIVRATFTKDDIQGEITYTGIDRSSKYNVVTVSYVEPNEKWTEQQVSYPDTEELRNYYKNLDGGRENKRDEKFTGITNYAIAYDMARLIFFKNREQDSITFTVSSRAFELEVGDIVYIQSNILQFGTDPGDINTVPWRIVSLKLNPDYTFLIGCVRHRPAIYPYVRINERVFKAELYVPIGQERIRPTEPKYYLGIYPPNNASRFGTPPVEWTAQYAPSNNPTSINDYLDAQAQWLASVTVAPINVTRVSYRSVNGQIFADVQFAQPDNPMYKSVTVYYKRNIVSETYWTKMEATDRPGVGKNIGFTIGPLIKRSYIVKLFVNFTTGETQDDLTSGVNFIINPTDMVGFYEDPTEFYKTDYTGWVTAIGVAPNNLKAQPLSVTGYPILSSGLPTTPRGITLTVKQDIDTYGMNSYVNGITIFYKSSAATYWKSKKFPMPANYQPGFTEPTFQITDLGIPEYPVIPTTGQLFDFAFRYEYSDGQVAPYPNYRVNNVPVEYKTGAASNGYQFDGFAVPNLIDGTNVSTALQTNIITEENAPPGAVVSPLDMKVGVRGLNTPPSPTTLSINVQPPNPADIAALYGVKVYYRLYKPGVLTTFTSQTISPIPHTASNVPDATYPYGKWTANITGLTLSPDIYEMVMVPIVAYNGLKNEGNYAYYAKGTLSNMPAIWTQMTTQQALNTIGSIPPDPNPVPQVLAWQRVYTNVNGNTYNDFYYQLKIQLPSDTTLVNVFRREKNNYGGVQPTYDNHYWGLGRWEYFQMTDNPLKGGWSINQIAGTGGMVGSELINGQRVLTINMRGPTGATAFKNNFTRTNDVIYAPPWGSTLDGGTSTSDLFPTAGWDTGHEFIIQVGTSTYGVSTNAIMLPQITKPTTPTTIVPNTTKPTVVAIADYADAKYTQYYNSSAYQFRSYKRGIEAPYAQSLILQSKMRDSTTQALITYPTATPGVY